MVRTKADGIKAAGSKAPRKQFNSSSSAAGSSSYSDSPLRNNSFPLVNHAKMWPTPKWQKNINSFFTKTGKSTNNEGTTSNSSSGSSSPTNNERIETGDVIVKNKICDNVEEFPAQSSTQEVVNNNNILSEDEPGPSKQKRSGKSRTKGPVSNRKRRVVIADDSDSD
ncbi:PCNA-associated factor-like isoform X1 [Hydractinia symbiolongicarpus]|uniref:PCNA-associated factor-like isoform X1 n=1 Tax=Hydractinia symbiolongicarpus TaxID=13093 RepID=UPI00254D74D5|nr:PCNA-associated factor-like isoform X1 [Hydractinia symbiolongicarpus]